MSSTGASASRPPIASMRRRIVVAIASTSSGSKAAAAPIDCWNDVAPRASRPWSVSSWRIAGIPSRVSSTRNRWISFPAAAAPGASRFVAPATRLIWPIPEASRTRRTVSVELALAPEQLERPHRPELGDLLVERHPGEEVGDALLDGQAGVAVAGLDRRHQPFTAPDVRPPTSWRSAMA